MGSALSSAYASFCSFVNAQLDKAEARRLMASCPQLRDLPAEERQRKLRWLMEDMEGHDGDDDDRLRGRDDLMPRPHVRYNYRHPSFRVDRSNTG
ncbi:hypothetical protein EJB05_30467, partial [Eragrostis curvula]